MQELLALLGLGATGGFLTNEAMGRLGDIGEQSVVGTQVEGPDGQMVDVPGALDLAKLGLDQTQFQPFSVTSSTGSKFGFQPTYDAEGALSGFGSSTTLSPEEQAIQSMLMGQAQSTLGAGPYGQAGGRAAAEQAYGLGGQFMQASQTQPADINALRGMFANQAASALGGGGQLGSSGQLPFGGQFNPQSYKNLTLPNGNTMPVDVNDPRLQGLSESQMIQKIMAPQAPSIGQLGQQALGLGSQGLATQAPSDVEALRQQYASLAGQAAGDVLGSTAGREADVYNRIRATQRPEEERQRMALEERLFNQGRSGVSTNMYGGTPEQLAMAKAQGEAQNQASLAAIQQAQAERQQSLGEAKTFGSMFGQQAGLSSDIQTQAQARASQLSTLGLSANQIESQLQTEGLGRAVTSSGQSAALAKMAGDLQAQQAGLGLGMSELGSQLSAQDMALLGAQQKLGLGSLAGAYIPQGQMNDLQAQNQMYAQLGQRGQLSGAGLFGEAAMGGLEARLIAEQAQANLLGNLGSGLLSGIFSPVAQAGGGATSLIGSALSQLSDIRLKENIKPAGNVGGVNFYTWDWNEEGKRIAGNQATFGVLAQEARETHPEAIHEGPDGYLRVDYSKIIKGVK